MALVNIALYCSKAEIRVPVVGGGGWWCKPIIMSNPQPSYFGLLLGWVAVAWLGFGVMTISAYLPLSPSPPKFASCQVQPCLWNTLTHSLAELIRLLPGVRLIFPDYLTALCVWQGRAFWTSFHTGAKGFIRHSEQWQSGCY